MGEIRFLTPRAKVIEEAFPPVNYRPPEQCKLLSLEDDGIKYGDLESAVAVQIALGEVYQRGFHAVETPDTSGPIVRYTVIQDGKVQIIPLNPIYSRKEYPLELVDFTGFVFQIIKDLETGERWEYIIGEAQDFNIYERPLLVATLKG